MKVVLIKDLQHKGKTQSDKNSVLFDDVPTYEIVDRDDKTFKFVIKNIITGNKYKVSCMQVVYLQD